MAQWRSGKGLDLRSIGPGFNSHRDKAVNNLGPVEGRCGWECEHRLGRK